VAVSDEAVWVADASGSAIRVDPAENLVDGEPVSVGANALAVAYGADAVWVVSQLDNTLIRIGN
jgi:streptogramin lyase